MSTEVHPNLTTTEMSRALAELATVREGHDSDAAVAALRVAANRLMTLGLAMLDNGDGGTGPPVPASVHMQALMAWRDGTSYDDFAEAEARRGLAAALARGDRHLADAFRDVLRRKGREV